MKLRPDQQVAMVTACQAMFDRMEREKEPIGVLAVEIARDGGMAWSVRTLTRENPATDLSQTLLEDLAEIERNGREQSAVTDENKN